jgi:hypothetical protein
MLMHAKRAHFAADDRARGGREESNRISKEYDEQ